MNFATLIKSIAVTTVFAAGSAIAAPVELVTNGSFETLNGNASLVSGTWSIFNNIQGWHGIGNGIEVRNNVAGTAFDGKYFVELDTTANSAMEQVINTTAGKHYTLSFAFEDRPGVASNSEGLQVFWGSQNLGTFNNAASWTTKTFDVVGNLGNTKLKFVAAGISDSYGSSLDKVSLTAAAPVPEPETYGMLLAGLALVGFAARRKSAK
jgi:hypothetical protein